MRIWFLATSRNVAWLSSFSEADLVAMLGRGVRQVGCFVLTYEVVIAVCFPFSRKIQSILLSERWSQIKSLRKLLEDGGRQVVVNASNRCGRADWKTTRAGTTDMTEAYVFGFVVSLSFTALLVDAMSDLSCDLCTHGTSLRRLQ